MTKFFKSFSFQETLKPFFVQLAFLSPLTYHQSQPFQVELINDTNNSKQICQNIKFHKQNFPHLC